MLKKEIIWRDILENAIHKKQYQFTQKDLAQNYGFSSSTVFNALVIPRAQGAIAVSGRGFSVTDVEKLLYIWATQKNLARDVVYQTSVSMGARAIEGLAPAGVVFGGCSAYAHAYGDSPAEYDAVYWYADATTIAEIKKRFPKRAGPANFFILKEDPFLKRFGSRVTPDTQIFTDLWNMKEWYAKDFLTAIKQKLLP